MRRIKSAPANIAEMVNRKKESGIKRNSIFASTITFKRSERRLDTKYSKDDIIQNQKYGKIKSLNSNTERITNILNDIFVDIFSLSFEETAFLGILLNLINNTFRKDKLKDLTAIIIQNWIKYCLMYYIHHYIFNDYIEKHGSIPVIHLLN